MADRLKALGDGAYGLIAPPRSVLTCKDDGPLISVSILYYRYGSIVIHSNL